MSDMQAVKVQLVEVTPEEDYKHRNILNSFSPDEDYEIHDYCQLNKIKILNNTIYRCYIEELDPCGFVTKSVGDDGIIEIVALWYDGGAYIDEVLEEGLNND